MKYTIAKFAAFGFLVIQLWNGMPLVGQETATRIKAGKRDDIILTTVTKVGNLTLQPGRYIVQHRVSHGKHVVRFVNFRVYGGKLGPFGTSNAGDQEGKLEPLKAKVEQTQVYLADEDGAKRIARIEIRGENVAHVF